MSAKVAKTVLKEYFKSSKRPNEEQFHQLIDSSYNEDVVYTSFVSGYHVLVSSEEARIIKRQGGDTMLVPVFRNLNGQNTRIYNYSLPACNLGADLQLSKIVWNIQLPPMGSLEVVESESPPTKKKIDLEIGIRMEVFNGYEKIVSKQLEVKTGKQTIDVKFDPKPQGNWLGISIDILFDYNIKLEVPLPSSFYQSEAYNKLLMLGFGGLGCTFLPR
jgi:hypothetical protein